MAEPTPVAPIPEPKSTWKPYVIGFLIGAVVLTVMPLMQRQFLKAPPPIRKLPAWSLPSLGGGEVSSSALAGKVVLLTIEPGPCAAECLQRQKDFGTGVHHVDDLGEKVVLVTVVGDEAKAGLETLLAGASPAWRFGSPDAALLAELQAVADQRAAPNRIDVTRSQAIVLIDQDNSLRDLWPGDGAGRGNSINAARLLAKYGPKP
ncbi:MAG: hypothetical protein ACOZQL_31690 [Myxococcota bacterium]